jgi:phosphoserine phosphatase
MLPVMMPEIAGYDLAGWNRPAARTGGDIFDSISLEGNRVLLLLADASGHGIGPALSVTQFRAMIRMAFRLQSDLHDLHSHANNQLVEDLTSDRFITAFVGLLDAGSGTISYHSCGQAPLLHYHGDTGQTDILEASALPFGIIPDMPLEDPGPLTLKSGDIFALISDGIFEQEDSGGEQFGVRRTVRLLHSNSGLSMDELADLISTRVRDFAGGTVQSDDMTIVLVKRN